jgi:hypothetical protein
VTGVRPWQKKNKNGQEPIFAEIKMAPSPFPAKKHGRHAPAVFMGFLPVGLEAQ